MIAVTAVTITLAHRDALYGEAVGICASATDLPLYLERGESERIKNMIRQLGVCAGVLDQISWREHGDREAYVLELEDGSAEFMQSLGPIAHARLEEDGADFFLEPRDPDETEETYLSAQACLREAMDIDLALYDVSRRAVAALEAVA